MSRQRRIVDLGPARASTGFRSYRRSSPYHSRVRRLAHDFGQPSGRIRRPASMPPRQAAATFTAWRSGELFAYVNDTAIGIPLYFDYFYWLDNKGKADLTRDLVP